MKLIKILKTPTEALSEAKKKKDKTDTILTLFVVSSFFGIAASLIVYKLTTMFAVFRALSVAATFSAFLMTFILIFIGAIFLSFLLNKIVNILGGKGEFYDGLTSVVYSLVPLSVGILLASVLVFVPVVGIFLGALILAIKFAIGMAILYRGTKEMYKTDMIVSFIAVSVLVLAVIVSLYSFLVLYMASTGMPIATMPMVR